MDFFDSKMKDDSLKNKFINDKQIFIVDFLNHRSLKSGGFSKIEQKPKERKKTHTYTNKRVLIKKKEDIEKKRKARSQQILGKGGIMEKQKQLHKQRNSKSNRIRSKIYSSYKYAQQLHHNRNLKPSVEVQTEWETAEQYAYSDLIKAKISLKKVGVEDILEIGKAQILREIKPTPSNTININRTFLKSHIFPTVRPLLDKNLHKFAKEKIGNVFTSAGALAVLMSSHRSIQSWDLTFVKRNGIIFIDHKVPSRVTEATTDERARDAPSLNEMRRKDVNSAYSLKKERTNLNKILSQQLLDEEIVEKGNDLYEQMGVTVKNSGTANIKFPKKVFKYRKIEIGKYQIVYRSEIDAYTKKGEELESTLIRAIHEYRIASKGSWSKLLQTSSGTVIADSVTDNSFEFSKWIFEALLADSKFLNVVFCSRKNKKNNKSHKILHLEKSVTRNIAKQFNVKLSNGWAILKKVLDGLQKLDDGNYILLKVPNKQCLQSYIVKKVATKKVETKEEKKEETKEEKKE